jgi:dTDP-glucose 4,6-dehydratase
MNIFGERQHPEKFIPLCIRAAFRGDEILVHSSPDGKPGSRFYIHARNVAAAVLHILNKFEGRCDKFNITGEAEMDNLSLANLIADILGLPIRVKLVDFHSSRPGHDLRYALDGTKLKRLGWAPPVCFGASLEKTIRWFGENRRWLENESR